MKTRNFLSRIKHNLKIKTGNLPMPSEYLLPIEIKKLGIIKNAFQNKLDTFSQTTKENFFKEFMIRFIYNTCAIDGNRIKKKAIKNILLHNKYPSKEPELINDILNSKKGLDFVFNTKEKLTKNLLFKLHEIIMEDIDHNAGKLRDHDVEIYGSMYMPSGYEILELEIEKLIQWYKETNLHVFEKAAIFHLRLVSIHPFLDGNGRLARLLFNFILWKNKYPMIVFPVSKKKEYFDALENCHIQDSPRPFINWMKKLYLG
ncbi:hypothetical protein GF327_02110 [Candidatus Woesearchaeota archaeon]|nr:hypothetical protein [Candidatus Woesearchaeota archaeon]